MRRNWVGGIIFIIIAAFVLINQAFGNFFGFISTGRLIISILLLFCIVKSIPRRNWFGILLPLAVFYSMYNGWFRWLMPFSNSAVFIAAILASIGLSMMFRQKPYVHHEEYWDKEWSSRGGKSWNTEGTDEQYSSDQEYKSNSGKYSGTADNMDGTYIYSKNSFSGATKYINSQALERCEFIASFAGLKVYFDQAMPCPQGAEVFLDISFAGAELFIPHDWKVIIETQAMLGGITEKGRKNVLRDNSPVLTLKGSVQFGGIDIIYV